MNLLDQIFSQNQQKGQRRVSIRNDHFKLKDLAKEYASKGEIQSIKEVEDDQNKKSVKEYLRTDALIYSQAFEDMIKQLKKEKEANPLQQVSNLQVSKMIDQVEKNNTKLDSPEVLQILKLIMKKPNYRRTEKEQKFIWKYMQSNPYFQSLQKFYPDNVMLELCRNMQVEEYNSTQRVFSQGEIGKKFYVVLEGQTACFSKVKKIEKESLFSVAISRMLFQIIKQEFEISPLQFPDVSPIKKILYMYPDQILIGSHNKGQYFGEIALRNDCPRTASIFAKTNIILAVINAADYRKIIQSFEDLQLQKSIGFLKNLSIFSQFEQTNLQEIWYLCTEKKYEKGQDVYIEDQLATHIYLIREGEVSISRIAENNLKDTKKTANQPEKIILKNGQWQQDLFQKKKEKIIIARLGENQYFGELELQQNKNSKRFTRATCECYSIIYSIPKKQLIHLFSQHGFSQELQQIFTLRENQYNEHTQKALQERNKQKIFKLEDKIDLNGQNKESIKLSFNKLRLFSQKCQFSKQHMEKLFNITNDESKQVEQEVQQINPQQVIWQDNPEKESFQTFLSSNLVSQMMEFFKDYVSLLFQKLMYNLTQFLFLLMKNFGQTNNIDTTFLTDFLKKTRNHHLIRLQIMWRQLKKRKPNLKDSMGLQFEKHIKSKESIDILKNSKNEKEIYNYKQDLIKLLKKQNIISKQDTIESLESSKLSSSYFRRTNQTYDINAGFDQIITPEQATTPMEKERKISIFQNTQISSQESPRLSKDSKMINLDQEQFVIPCCYNYGINTNNVPQLQKKHYSSVQQQNQSNSRDTSISNKTNMITNGNGTNFTLPQLKKNQSSPHFVKAQKKAISNKEFNKSIQIKNKLQII